MVSIWRRLFQRSEKPQAVLASSSLKEQYQRKVQRYLQILAASNRALEIMAQMQASLEGEGDYSPAYVQVSSATVLRHTGEAIRTLQGFCRDQLKHQELSEIFAILTNRINAELAPKFNTDLEVDQWSSAAPRSLWPFEQQLLASPELLASGQAYPAPESDSWEEVVIEGIWGWGPAAPEAARRYLVTRDQITTLSALAESQPEPGRGGESKAIAREPQPLLQDAELRLIADYVRQLTTAYHQGLQRVEWGLGVKREIVILRSLPHPSPPAAPGLDSVPRPELILSGGISIYPGRTVGPALPLQTDQIPDPGDIPAGAVIWAAKPSLALAPLLSQAAALVVATGEPYNHLAFLARECRVPTIFNSGMAKVDIAPGEILTVDAIHLQVYAGRPVLPEPTPPVSRSTAVAPEMLQRLRPWFFPLKVMDLPDDALPPTSCQSIHDILYYTTQAGVDEMFCLSLRGRVTKKDGVSLVTGRLVPILVIDAGEGLSAETPTVNFEAITSIPYRAFLSGMMSIPWPKARPVDMKGFISVIGVTSTTPRSEEQLQKFSFAVLSRNYMNFSLCLGYHASTIEAHIGANLDHNYIRFHYQGGAASLERRVRRLQLIDGVLSRLGFKVNLNGDLLDARLVGEPTPSLVKVLEILGRLEVYTKQMDMVMSDDGVVFGYIEDFFDKHCNADLQN
ncbi:MAG: PEP-utilizing enzyme [Desulfobacca sp.]|nr:PEP-utilizing enzyme [Desulfobacca sp.]